MIHNTWGREMTDSRTGDQAVPRSTSQLAEAALSQAPRTPMAEIATGAGNLPVTLLGANPASWLTTGVAGVNLLSVGVASAGLFAAAAVPVRLAALGSLSGHVARLTVSAGGAAAGALIDLSTPGARPSRSFGDAYEDAV